jgi:cytosine/adenosine deaminase-related metal-dependent hydrolase
MAETTLLRHVIVVNVEIGDLVGRTSVLIRDGRLAGIRSTANAEDAVHLDGRCGLLIPGL